MSGRWLETVGLTQREGERGGGSYSTKVYKVKLRPRGPTLTCRKRVQVYIQLFRERLSQKLHATIPKSIVGGFI